MQDSAQNICTNDPTVRARTYHVKDFSRGLSSIDVCKISDRKSDIEVPKLPDCESKNVS